MFCRNCGTQLEDGARFCPECGTQVADVAAAEPVQPVEQPAEPAAPEPAAEPAQPEAAPQQPEQPAAQPEPQPQPAAQQQPAAAYAAQQPQYAPQPAGPQYAKGCLAQAFSDMTKVKGVFARVCQIAFLPALIGVVSVIVAFIPVIGWLACPLGLLLAYVASVCGSGYAIEWGRDLTRGEGFDINKPLLRSSAFAIGIFASALTTVLSLVAWVPSTMFNILSGQNDIANLLASYFFRTDTFASSYMASSLDVLSSLLSSLLSLASVVFTVIFGMVSAAAVMRLAMTGRIESAFSLGKVWKSCKKELGKLFCATVLADLLVGLVAFLVLLVVTIVFIVVAGIFSAGYASSYSSVGYSNYGGGFSGFLGGLGGMLAIYLVIVVFVVMFSSVFGSMLKYRALGHWAARYAEGWTDGNDPDFTIYLPGDRKPGAVAVPVAAAPAAAQPVAAPVNPAAQPAASAEPAPAAQPAAEPAQPEAAADSAQAAPAQQNPFGPTDPGPLA